MMGVLTVVLPLFTQGRVDPGAIRTQELVAKAGSIVSLAVASAPIVVHLMDVIVGGGEAN